MTATLSSKGQIVLPKTVRMAHRWVAGTQFVVEEASGGVLLRPVRRERGEDVTLDDVIGCAGYVGPARTIAEMDAGIRRASPPVIAP